MVVLNMEDIIEERMLIAYERISQIKEDEIVSAEFLIYFKTVATFLENVYGYYRDVEHNIEKSIEQLKVENQLLYKDVLPLNYDTSYANPSFCCLHLTEQFGSILAVLYREIRSSIPLIYEQNKENITILMELFLEVYGLFTYAYLEHKELPKYETVKDCFYWYLLDYSEFFAENKIYQLVDPEYQFFTKKIRENEFTDLRYLYETGEYVTDVELKTAAYINQLPEETIKLMASTFTEGYRLGFIATRKDITKKKSVAIVYQMGFERVIKKAIQLFQEMGLDTCIRRKATTLSCVANGFSGQIANKQYEFDHKNDEALFLDKLFSQRKLEALKFAFEKMKEQALLFGGPAVMEVFGEEPFAPAASDISLDYTKEQQKLLLEYKKEAFEIQNQYIIEEERSFTIIAFPIPEIGENFEEIFDQIILVNTLDYTEYQRMQQILIDALDEALWVKIIGGNGNKTNLIVSLQEITDKNTQTKFENCVADVNIPVGEVFTSPKLKGTTGKLHVKKVFLHGLEYKHLEVDFMDGFTTTYQCENFEEQVENQKYIKENLLNHHDTLPMGEFAIGTNTVAYMVAKKYKIHKKLPILIAEKMGPHFALGDTCYSHVEHISMFNSDGKEIIARANEETNHTDLAKNKYFNCHTDITIPYDELAELSVMKEDGSTQIIIQDGRFQLKGLEALNAPFDL